MKILWLNGIQKISLNSCLHFEDIFAPRDRYKDTLEKEGVPEIEVEKYLIEYDKQKEHMHAGKCFCGSDKYVLDWRSILFQCLSKA